MPITSAFKQNELGNPLQGVSDYVKLPFPTLRLRWHNGYPQASKDSGTQHFGGWFNGGDEYAEDLANFPASLHYMKGPDTWVSKDGKEYEVYHNRAIFAAPVATRVRWITKENGYKSSVTEILAVVADRKDKGSLFPYGAAVLSCSGMGGLALVDAFREWVKKTTKARVEFAPGVPSNMFYVVIGTFGKQRITRMVGKTSQSPIVPAQVNYADKTEIDEGFLASYFVGDEVGAKMIELKTAAAEWLADVKEKGKAEAAPAPVNDNDPHYEPIGAEVDPFAEF